MKSVRTVMVEAPFEEANDGQTSRLVDLKDGNVGVVDVAVTYEAGDALKEAAMVKRQKYSIQKETLPSRFRGESFGVFPSVVGCRGSSPGYKGLSGSAGYP